MGPNDKLFIYRRALSASCFLEPLNRLRGRSDWSEISGVSCSRRREIEKSGTVAILSNDL